jgi:hypothetical protein
MEEIVNFFWWHERQSSQATLRKSLQEGKVCEHDGHEADCSSHGPITTS